MANVDEKTIQAKIAEHAKAINALAQQRDEFVTQANIRITEINTAIIQREGAIIELRSLVPEAPPPAPPPRRKKR